MALDTPPKLLEAIAADAGAGFITNPMPDAPTGTNAASIQGGFPPKTMQNELAGGLPPLGQDMNGFLFLISSHTLWVEAGQRYLYDADVATAIGGYPMGTQLGMADGTGAWLSTANNNMSNPDTGGAGWVPIESYGFTQINALTGGTVTLTAAQSKKGVIILNGVLTSNLAVNLPPNVQEWLIINNTGGAFSTTVKTAAGGSLGVTVPQGGFGAPTGVYSTGDGNIYPTVAPLGIPIDQNPNPLTIVERTNSGYILATYFNSSAPLEPSTSIGAVFCQQVSADGYLRKIPLTQFEAQILLQGLGGQLVNGQVPFSVINQWASTLFASPALTGVPTAPTAATGTSSSQIATTAFANPGVTVNGNGICIHLPNGYKIQFGSCNPNNGSVLVTYPVAFTTGNVFGYATSVAGGAVTTWIPTGSLNQNNMRVANSGGTAFWLAVGQ